MYALATAAIHGRCHAPPEHPRLRRFGVITSVRRALRPDDGYVRFHSASQGCRLFQTKPRPFRSWRTSCHGDREQAAHGRAAAASKGRMPARAVRPIPMTRRPRPESHNQHRRCCCCSPTTSPRCSRKEQDARSSGAPCPCTMAPSETTKPALLPPPTNQRCLRCRHPRNRHGDATSTGFHASGKCAFGGVVFRLVQSKGGLAGPLVVVQMGRLSKAGRPRPGRATTPHRHRSGTGCVAADRRRWRW